MPEKIKNEKEEYAIIIRKNESFNGTEFFTKDTDEFQMGIIVRKEGESIAPHRHIEQRRCLNKTSEALLIRKGTLIADFYKENEVIKSVILSEGDVILLFGGSHGFRNKSKNIEILEIKQGPYVDGKDKIWF